MRKTNNKRNITIGIIIELLQSFFCNTEGAVTIEDMAGDGTFHLVDATSVEMASIVSEAVFESRVIGITEIWANEASVPVDGGVDVFNSVE